MKKNKKCDFDCFNCKYDDCISDMTFSPNKDDAQKPSESAYQKYREKILKKAKESYKRNREKRIQYAHDYYQKNREIILQKAKEKRHASNSIQ